MLVPGDLSDPAHCRAVVDRAVQEFGGIDVLVNNAAYKMTHQTLEEISDDEWDCTFKLNVGAYFYLTKAVLPFTGAGWAGTLCSPRASPNGPEAAGTAGCRHSTGADALGVCVYGAKPVVA